MNLLDKDGFSNYMIHYPPENSISDHQPPHSLLYVFISQSSEHVFGFNLHPSKTLLVSFFSTNLVPF